MTPQEIFDTVARHLFAQGTRSYDPVEDQCLYRYRSPEGIRSCAVGRLIPDEVYDCAMEGSNVNHLLLRWTQTKLPEWMCDNAALLRGLQYEHDCDENWESSAMMRQALGIRAKAFNLNAALLDTLSFGDR